MTRPETKTLLGLIVTAYPGSKIAADDRTVDLWFEMLADLPAEAAAVATKAMFATLKFPPTIADIREAVAKSAVEVQGGLTAGDALVLVRKALKHPGYYDFKGEARQMLGERIWNVVLMVAGSWSELCMCEDPNWPARFERLYNEQQHEQQRQLQIPAQVREHLMALGAGQGMKMIGGGSGA